MGKLLTHGIGRWTRNNILFILCPVPTQLADNIILSSITIPHIQTGKRDVVLWEYVYKKYLVHEIQLMRMQYMPWCCAWYCNCHLGFPVAQWGMIFSTVLKYCWSAGMYSYVMKAEMIMSGIVEASNCRVLELQWLVMKSTHNTGRSTPLQEQVRNSLCVWYTIFYVLRLVQGCVIFRNILESSISPIPAVRPWNIAPW